MSELPKPVSDQEFDEALILATLDEQVARTYLQYLLQHATDLKQNPIDTVIPFSEYHYLAAHTQLFELENGEPLPERKAYVPNGRYKLTEFGKKVLRYALVLGLITWKGK